MIGIDKQWYFYQKNECERILIKNNIFKKYFDNKKIINKKKDILFFIEKFFNEYEGKDLYLIIPKTKYWIHITKIDKENFRVYQLAPVGCKDSENYTTTLDNLLKSSKIALDDTFKLYINNYKENFIEKTLKEYEELKKQSF